MLTVGHTTGVASQELDTALVKMRNGGYPKSALVRALITRMYQLDLVVHDLNRWVLRPVYNSGLCGILSLSARIERNASGLKNKTASPRPHPPKFLFHQSEDQI